MKLLKRHTQKCREDYTARNPEKAPLKEYDNSLTRCKCSWSAEGVLRIDGFVRQSTRQRIHDKAKEIAEAWERVGTVEAAPPLPNPDPTDTHTTIETAKEEFRSGYMAAKALKPNTRRGYETMLTKLTDFADKNGLRFVGDFDLGQLQAWQKTWDLKPRSAVKRLELLSKFFDFCRKRHWITDNPTEDMEHARIGVSQKEPFTEAEIDAILTAAEGYATKRPPRADADAPKIDYYHEGPRVYAACLLLLYSGMRISDLVVFRRSDLDSRDRVNYFPVKINDEGESQRMVTVKLPNWVATKLRALTPVREEYLFITSGGSTDNRSITDTWRKKFNIVFERAGELMEREFTSTPTPHRFRHTFAIRLLLRGVTVDDVADALGHSDPRITLRHYRRWVPGLQDRLDAILDDAWSQDRKPRLVKGKRQA